MILQYTVYIYDTQFQGYHSMPPVELVDALKLCGLNASEAAATTVMQEIDKARRNSRRPLNTMYTVVIIIFEYF